MSDTSRTQFHDLSPKPSREVSKAGTPLPVASPAPSLRSGFQTIGAGHSSHPVLQQPPQTRADGRSPQLVSNAVERLNSRPKLLVSKDASHASALEGGTYGVQPSSASPAYVGARRMPQEEEGASSQLQRHKLPGGKHHISYTLVITTCPFANTLVTNARSVT